MSLTRNSDVDLANSYIAIVIESYILHERIFENSNRSFETLRLDFHSGDTAAVVNGSWHREVHRQQLSIRSLLYDYRLLRTVLEDRRLVVYTRRESVIVTQQRFGHRFLASHKLELQTGVVHVADDAEDHETGLHVLGQGDHRQFAVISRVTHGQIEIREIDDVILVLRLFVEETDLRGPADNVIGDHAFYEERFHSIDATEIDADVSEGLLLAAPTGHRVQPDVPGLVVRSLGGGVYRRVRDASGSQTEGSDDFALRLANADDRSRADEDVTRPVAAELHLRALLVATCHLKTVARPTRILTDRTFASQVTEVPDAVRLTTHDIVVAIGLAGQFESILTAEEEWGLILGVQILAILGAGRGKRLAAIHARTSRLQTRQPVIRQAGFGIVHALPEIGCRGVAQIAAVAAALEGDILLEGYQHAGLVISDYGKTLVFIVRQGDTFRICKKLKNVFELRNRNMYECKKFFAERLHLFYYIIIRKYDKNLCAIIFGTFGILLTLTLGNGSVPDSGRGTDYSRRSR